MSLSFKNLFPSFLAAPTLEKNLDSLASRGSEKLARISDGGFSDSFVNQRTVIAENIPVANFIKRPEGLFLLIMFSAAEELHNWLKTNKDPTHLNEAQVEILKYLSRSGPQSTRAIMDSCPNVDGVNVSWNLRSLVKRKLVDKYLSIEHQVHIFSISDSGKKALDKALAPVANPLGGKLKPAFRMSGLHHSHFKSCAGLKVRG